MIDSVLKGTGNSRFLKSAVPAGTSWADALAMLQAGTFPIDFNGINTEGFQQVGTPLNKANLLKDATAAQIGLPPSTTPDGMFQALGNTGELHVWRKTARDASVSAPGYNLGDIKSNVDICQAPSGHIGYFGVKAEYSDEVIVNDLGVISLVSPSEIELEFTGSTATFFPKDAANTLKNKFLKIVSVLAEQPNATILGAYKGAVIHCESNFSCGGYGNSSPGYIIYFNKFRPVTPYPAGLSTTYPVSTNPNAYQEGDDAKAAGYTLGEVVNGTFQFAPNYNTTNAITYQSCSNLQISNDGAVGIDTSDPSCRQVTFEHNTNVDRSDFSNRFVRLSSYAGGSVSPNPQAPFNGAVPSQIVYIPSDTTFDFGSPSTFDRYQPVTGYAAIPAGTIIEYLGKLGDKARVQVVSYVGTGTYGKDNKNQLTFSRKPRFIMVPGDAFGYAYIPKGRFYYVLASNYATLEDLFCVWDDDTNTMTWYHPSYPYRQYNKSGTKYTFVAIY